MRWFYALLLAFPMLAPMPVWAEPGVLQVGGVGLAAQIIIIRLTGGDGYVVDLALPEIAPEFAARPVLLADWLSGAAIPKEGWRLIVPGEKRLGRSVRDVMNIVVDQP